jgi:hypothetical protein
MGIPADDLVPGEELIAHARVSFRGAATTSTRATFALGSARMRHKAFDQWRQGTDAAGFPSAGPEMVLAVTDRRLLVCYTTFWLSRPASASGALELKRIHETAVVRQGLVTTLAIVLDNGHIIEVEAMRGGAVRRIAAALDAARQRR